MRPVAWCHAGRERALRFFVYTYVYMHNTLGHYPLLRIIRLKIAIPIYSHFPPPFLFPFHNMKLGPEEAAFSGRLFML